MARPRKRRKTKVEKKMEPGRAVLPEDRIRRAAEVLKPPSKRGRRRRVLGPLATETVECGQTEIETRVLRAMQTLRAMPDGDRRMMSMKVGWPEYTREYLDAYGADNARMPRFRPTPADVSDYLTALSWVRHLPRYHWNLIWARSFGYSFGVMAKFTGQSDETVRRHYREAITDVWMAANGLKAA